jgi:hypothetical protein
MNNKRKMKKKKKKGVLITCLQRGQVAQLSEALPSPALGKRKKKAERKSSQGFPE